MMKITVLAALAGSAAAFAPASQGGRVSTAVNFDASQQLGVIDPTGFFDPLGLSRDITEEKFNYYRSLELKHGRISMLAVLGYVAPETYRFGFDIAPGVSTSDIPNGVAAIDAIPALGWLQIIFLIGAVDYWGVLGDFEFGKPDLGDTEDDRKLQELQHGRIAMLGFMELLRHDSQNFVSPGFDGMDNLITGLPFIYGN